MALRVVDRRGHDGIVGRRQTAARLLAELLADEVAERAEEVVGGRIRVATVIGQRTACITISRISGDAAKMRTPSPASGTSGGSNSTEMVVTEACRVAWCVHPAGIQAAWCGGSR